MPAACRIADIPRNWFVQVPKDISPASGQKQPGNKMMHEAALVGLVTSDADEITATVLTGNYNIRLYFATLESYDRDI